MMRRPHYIKSYCLLADLVCVALTSESGLWGFGYLALKNNMMALFFDRNQIINDTSSRLCHRLVRIEKR